MSDVHLNDEIPRVPLAMIAGLAALTLALAAMVNLGLIARDAVPSEARAAAGTRPAEQRSLFFTDEPDGAVRIEDAATGEEVDRVEPGTGGFVRSTLRSLVHVRRQQGIGAETPFELVLWDDGGLTLMDSETGESVELGSFGPDNRAVFAALLEEGEG